MKNWECDGVFLYVGIDEGDLETLQIFETLDKEEKCTVRSKTVFAYKNKDKDLTVKCPKCSEQFIEHIDMGYHRKSNCDVDLTVDAMELAETENEFYIFTGDGDFEFLIRRLNNKGTKVHVVSSGKRIQDGPRHFTSRLSTKLRHLFDENKGLADFINIDNLKLEIKK